MPQFHPLRARADFLQLKKAKAVRATHFIVQAAATQPPQPFVRIGFIITKKIGNAVVRNRIRRRLKAALQSCTNSDKQLLHHGWDYVLIPRFEVLTLPFAELEHGLALALQKFRLHPST